eukprot:COSAG03_NODE_13456_length_502_cov_2.181141_1_plen_81_part_01
MTYMLYGVGTYDRRAYGPNQFSFAPQSALCNGEAATAAEFDTACTVRPWQAHFGIIDVVHCEPFRENTTCSLTCRLVGDSI